ncbi:MAG: hypothetical protein ACYCTY_03445 [Sulfuricella sp.]
MDKLQGQRTCLYATADLVAVLADMARQAAGQLSGRERIAIVGLLRRGAPLAEMLRDRLARDWMSLRRTSSSATCRPTSSNSRSTCFDQTNPEKNLRAVE